MKKAVIVGCGSIAAVHAAVLASQPQSIFTGVADIKFEKAQQFAEKYNVTPYSSMEEMIDKEHPDVLHICTPHYLHVPMAKYALSRGINVFMEKPPAISLEQLEELKASVKASTAKLGLCYQNRYNSSYKTAKQYISSGKAGKVYGGRAIVTWDRPEPYYTQSDWRGRLATEGGGVLINQAVHTLDLLVSLLGKPRLVDASLSNHHLKEIIEVEDTIEAYIEFDDKKACFYATNAYCASVPPLIEICCENTTIRIEDQELTYYHKDGTIEKPKLDLQKALGKDYWGSGHAACIGDFYDSLEQGKRFMLDLDAMEESIRLMLGVYESARKNQIVRLD